MSGLCTTNRIERLPNLTQASEQPNGAPRIDLDQDCAKRVSLLKDPGFSNRRLVGFVGPSRPQKLTHLLEVMNKRSAISTRYTGDFHRPLTSRWRFGRAFELRGCVAAAEAGEG